ncbi:hypothetical protein HZC53_00550 [Candidatus Uhrbacteria bacterium]|nr:hypothetical protein [Candidatus Uhrbacteria bacterium]
MNEIIPAILAQDEKTFRERLKAVKDLAPMVQIDVLDGTLFRETSWFDVAAIKAMEIKADLELHLMVSQPKKYIEACRVLPNVKRVIWHIEAHIDHAELIILCEEYGLKTGLAIAPKTPLDEIEPFADMVEEILVLGVEPGKSGQNLINETIDKARTIALAWPNAVTGFDGGIAQWNLERLRDAGVTRFCVASGIFGATDPKEALMKFQNL